MNNDLIIKELVNITKKLRLDLDELKTEIELLKNPETEFFKWRGNNNV